MTIDNTAHDNHHITVTDRGYISQKPIPTGIPKSDLGYSIVIETRKPYRLRPSQSETLPFDADGYTRSTHLRPTRPWSGAGWYTPSTRQHPVGPNAAAE